MKYQVFDGGKPAELAASILWNNSVYNTFDEARKYAWKWLGDYGGSSDGETGYPLVVNVPWDYGYGDMIEIREIPD